MFKQILNSSQNLDWLAIVSLIFFFVFFSIVIFKTLKMKKSEVNFAKLLPFDKEGVKNVQN